MWQKFKNYYHLLIAVVASLLYGFPVKKLIIVGVTGTDGKTTTVNLIYHILQNCGISASMISSTGAVINGKEYDIGFHVTTPSSFSIQRFLKKAVQSQNNKKKYLVLEVTSHALDQYRTWGINFEVSVLTNVTHEHLDYHKTYENYVLTKAKLLTKAKTAIINMDDGSYELIAKIIHSTHSINSGQANTKWVTYGLNKNAEINPSNFTFQTNLIGEFNKYNILAAVGACKMLGLSDEDIKRGIKNFVPPIGREEIVYKNSFSVMIDFAHTPNALKQVLSSIRPLVKERIIHVFGSAGERDHKKRPLMGKYSSEYADVIVLTAEDPRSEPVNKIIDEIESGIKNKQIKLLKIPNRQEAVMSSIQMAKKGDLVILTGKAHEKSMNYGNGEEHWSEYEAVEKALEIRKKTHEKN